ncbi:hypothetical protein [Halobacteriovorax sp.]|uniref:hypothetical protein n=1 Tax=Halobacteriovorax sp. TaxID=2020862 RepID=UPI003AF1EBEA
MDVFQKDDPNEAREALVNSYPELTQAFKSCGHEDIVHQWREFEEQIIAPDGERVMHYMNTLPPSEYFDEEGIIGENFTLRHIESISAKLTGIGILGTFLGLTLGVSEATSVLDTADSAQLMGVVKELLQSAGTAFYTSLLGLSLSMIFSYVEKSRYGKFSNALHDLINGLERCLEFYTVEKNNLQMLEEARKQTREISNMGNEIALAFENVISKKLSIPMSGFSERITSQLEEIKDANIESSKTISNSMAEVMTGGTGGENLNRARESAHNALEAIANTMQTTLSDLVEKQSQMSTLIETAISRMSDQMNTGASNYQSTMNESLDKLTSSIDELVENLKFQLAESVTKMSEGVANSQKDAFTTFENSTQKVGSLVSELANRNVEYTDNVITQTKESFSQINEGFSETLSNLNNSFVNSIKSANEQIGNQNKEILESFNSKIKGLDRTITDFNRGINDMGSSVDNFSNSIPYLREPANELNNAVNLFKLTSETMGASARSIKESSDQIVKGSDINSSVISNLENIMRESNSLNENLKTVWSNYDSRFSGVDQNLENVFINLNKGIDTLSDKSTQHVARLTEQLNTIVAHFNSIIEELTEVVEKKA